MTTREDPLYQRDYQRAYRKAHPERKAFHNRRYNRKHRKRLKAKYDEWRKANPAAAYGYSRAWVLRNPEKGRAYQAVIRALRNGRLTRGCCEVCQSSDVHAHHDDYSKPLAVRWVCAAHHKDIHRKEILL